MGPEDLQLCPLLSASCWSWGGEAEGVGSSRKPFLMELVFQSRGALLRWKEVAVSVVAFYNLHSTEFAIKRLF